MANVKHKNRKWPAWHIAVMASTFGHAQLRALIESRVVSLMQVYAGENAAHEPAPANRVADVAQRLNIDHERVLARICTMVYAAVGMNNAKKRKARRAELGEYAHRGVRTIAEIRAADAEKKHAKAMDATAVQAETQSWSASFGIRLDAATLERLDAYAERIGRKRGGAAVLAMTAGLDAIDGIHAAVPPPQSQPIHPIVLDAGAPAILTPRTLDTIAAELREARATAVRLAVECKAAEDRMAALGAELHSAVRDLYEPTGEGCAK